MAPTIPPSFVCSCSCNNNNPLTITISSDSDESLSRSVVILSSTTSLAVLPSPPAPAAAVDDNEATSRRRVRRWCVADELKILDTIADLRRGNMGVQPQVSVLLRALQAARPPLRRRGLKAAELSQKIYHLKNRFADAAAEAAINGGKLITNSRKRALFQHSIRAWPELITTSAAANAARRLPAARAGVARIQL